MKILITGAKGYLGSHLVPFLEKKGHVVVSWDLVDDEDIFDDVFEDILITVDIVIHLAAKVEVKDSFINPYDYFRTNIRGTIHVATLCAKHYKRLIYTSSAAVCEPESSPYALSKSFAEQAVQELGEINKFVILRLFNIYSIPPKKGSVLDHFLYDKLPLINGDGMQTRDFIRIEDVCNIILDSFQNRYNNLTIDVGMGKAIDINTVSSYFEKHHKKLFASTNKAREIVHSVAQTKLLDKVYAGPYVTNLEEDIKNMKGEL